VVKVTLTATPLLELTLSIVLPSPFHQPTIPGGGGAQGGVWAKTGMASAIARVSIGKNGLVVFINGPSDFQNNTLTDNGYFELLLINLQGKIQCRAGPKLHLPEHFESVPGHYHSGS
jgi:hypothetical protein